MPPVYGSCLVTGFVDNKCGWYLLCEVRYAHPTRIKHCNRPFNIDNPCSVVVVVVVVVVFSQHFSLARAISCVCIAWSFFL